jgi:hypothetical protein
MQYIKEDVERMLIEHKENEGKLLEIELKIDEYENRLNYAGTVHQDTAREVIESMQLAGQAYDSVHSNTNKVSDKTSSTAINYRKELNHINREDRDFLEGELERLKEEKENTNKKVVRVINWLDKITSEQKKVIMLFYINNKGKNWDKVVKEYSLEYNKDISERGLRKIRDKALESILKMVNI